MNCMRDIGSNPWIRQQCCVGGRWIEAANGVATQIFNPASGELVGSVPFCTREETAQAIGAASIAFEDWARRTAKQRSELLYALNVAMLENQTALAALITLENGKPIAEAEAEIAFSAAYVKWFAEEAKRIYGEVIPSPWSNKRLIVTREPVGVVGAITPWNFPSSMIARKLGAALAAGCTIVVKPAPQTPFSALAFAALAEKVGIPEGVVNVVTGSAPDIGAEMCENRLLHKITFTGSTRTGKLLASNAARYMKRISLELGGNAPFIVFDDADLPAAVDGAMVSKFRNTGQTCVSVNRFLVQSRMVKEFTERFSAATKALKVGDGFETGVEQGPLINKTALEKVEDLVDDATSKGAVVVAGGKRHALGGTYYEPTVLLGIDSGMRLANEEIFGPVASITSFETEGDAVRLANDTPYGLACYFYSRDLTRAWRVMERLQYGMVGINDGLVSTEVAPFGGVKESGIGREGSRHGIEDYVNVKYACFGGMNS